MSKIHTGSKLAAAVAASAVAFAASAELTSRSYVQRGLAVQYDGINNAGHDEAHDPAAATWVDLTGGGADGTVASGVTWTDGGWQYNGTAAIKPVTVGSGLAAAIAANGMLFAQMTFTPSSVRP